MKTSSTATSGIFSISNVALTNNQLVITGRNLDKVSQLKVKDPNSSFDEAFVIESQSATSIVANSTRNLSMAIGTIFDLVLSNANAASTFQINFTLCGANVDCLWTPGTGGQAGNVYRATGNVGIGTTTPSALLDVKGSDVGGTVLLSVGSDSTPAAVTIESIAAANGQKLTFYDTDGFSSLSITGTGGCCVLSAMESRSGLAFYAGAGWDNTTYGAFNFYSFYTGITAVAGNQSFIHITPKIDQGGTAGYTGLLLDSEETTLGSGNNYLMQLKQNGTQRLAVRNDGHLGIGIDPSSYALDVNGDSRIASGSALYFGSTSICTISGCTSPSDSRLKEGVTPLHDSLEKILKLDGVQYYFIDKKSYGDKKQIGFIAQDVEKTFPEVVKTDAKTGFKSIAYDHLVPSLVEALKKIWRTAGDQQKSIDDIKKKLSKVEEENTELKKYICQKDQKAPFCRR